MDDLMEFVEDPDKAKDLIAAEAGLCQESSSPEDAISSSMQKINDLLGKLSC